LLGIFLKSREFSTVLIVILIFFVCVQVNLKGGQRSTVSDQQKNFTGRRLGAMIFSFSREIFMSGIDSRYY
jgi:hypothetical protein